MNKRFVFILTVIVFLLIIRFILFFLFRPQLQVGQQISFCTTILSEPQNSSRYNSLTANYGNVFGSEKIIVYYSSKISLNYGDVVCFSGRVEKVLLGNKNLVLSMYFPKVEAVKKRENPVLALALLIRHRVEILYSETLSKTDASLLLGIVLGVKGDFPKSFLQNLQATGVMHVIAASGMNVTLVSGFVFSVLSPLFRRQITLVITIFMILFYMILSGLQSSIIRAGIMAMCGFSAQLVGRQYNGLYGLFLAAAGMLLWNPNMLFDVGFQLSVGSTLGILVLKPLFPSYHVLDDITTTISAQIMTLPIMFANFGSYGICSIIVNALVLWTVPILMIIGGVGALIGLFLPSLGNMIILLAVPFLWFFETVVNMFGNMGFVLTVTNVPTALIIGYYCILFSVINIFKNKPGVVEEEK